MTITFLHCNVHFLKVNSELLSDQAICIMYQMVWVKDIIQLRRYLSLYFEDV